MSSINLNSLIKECSLVCNIISTINFEISRSLVVQSRRSLLNKNNYYTKKEIFLCKYIQ